MFSALRRFCRAVLDGFKYLGASLAILLVKRKLRRRPHDWSLWLLLGRLYEIGYQWSLAVDALERARQLNPQSQVVMQLLARMRQEAQQEQREGQ